MLPFPRKINSRNKESYLILQFYPLSFKSFFFLSFFSFFFFGITRKFMFNKIQTKSCGKQCLLKCFKLYPKPYNRQKIPINLNVKS